MTKTLLCVLALLWVWCLDSHAYVRSTKSNGVPIKWADGHATLNPQVGCSTGLCYTAAVRAAAQEWNRAGARFTFRITSVHAPWICSQRDELVSILQSGSVCGEAWGEETLATTLRWTSDDGRILDAEVFLNSSYNWDVHDGIYRSWEADLQRVVLHELGHVLGLAHPNDHGQTVPAIMNSHIKDVFRLQPDDIAGIRAIYGRSQQTITKGTLENPGPNAAKTGIGIISGWVCDATQVEVEVKGSRIATVYGTSRGDTQSVCGDADNGFVVLVNWNNFGPGIHRVRLLADGRELVSRSVTVETYDTAFLRGKSGRWRLEDWPTPGTETIIGWTEALQNMEIVDILRRPQDRP